MGYPTIELVRNKKTNMLHMGRNKTQLCNNRFNADLVSHGEIANTPADLLRDHSDKACKRCFPNGVYAYVTQRNNDIATWEANGIQSHQPQEDTMETVQQPQEPNMQNDFATYEQMMQREIKHAKMCMRDDMSTMASAAKDLMRLATQAVESVQALQRDQAYQPNLADHIEGVVERYKNAERDMQQQALQVRSLEWMLLKAKETFCK